MVENYCPITGLEFKPKGSTLLNHHFKLVSFNDELDLVVSKVSSNLPLTDFRVDVSTPCLDFPRLISLTDENQTYELF